jgi:hypothetical protein
MQEKFEDTKWVIKNHKSQDRQCNGKDTKGVIRIRKSMDRQYNGEKTKEQNDLQNITQKNKDWATGTHTKKSLEIPKW